MLFYDNEQDLEYIMYLQMQSENLQGDSPEPKKENILEQNQKEQKDYFALQVIPKKKESKKEKSKKPGFSPFPFLDKDQFDTLRDIAINTNAEIVSRAAKTFEEIAKVELPDFIRDKDLIKATSREIFSDETLEALKNQT